MTRSKGLQFTWVILLITQLSSIDSSAQTALVRTALETSDHLDDDTITAPSTSASTEELSTLSKFVHPQPTALRSRDPKKLGAIDRAYLDVFTILNDDNSCSRFFGGRNAITALTEMVLQLKRQSFDRNVAIRMSGPTTIIHSHSTGFTFRLFEKMELNIAGSFLRTPAPFERFASITPIFPPNTRETRVVVFLHELGHLIRKPNKEWVLMDDGDDPIRSIDNTQRVLSTCRQQIDSLSRLTAEQELDMTTTLAQKMTTGPSTN